MKTSLCPLLAIEHPIVGFSPSEHVAAAISRAASARAGALWFAASPRSATEASASARLTRSMVAIPVTAAMTAIAMTRMPPRSSTT